MFWTLANTPVVVINKDNNHMTSTNILGGKLKQEKSEGFDLR
jgi:hypothetical protein